MPEPRKRGRPPGPVKLAVDPEIAKRICDNLELGMPLRPSAECEGVPDTTVRGWVTAFPDFAAQVTRARAQGMKGLVIRSLKGGKGSSNAEFHLQRRYREDYGPPKGDLEQHKVEIVVHGGLPKRRST
ncbi:MAG: terminase small subunit-like protein [Acidiferrobacteraceae bacterium]